MNAQDSNLKDSYIKLFNRHETELNGSREKPVHALRKDALSHFKRMEFPSTRTEDWKYTDLTPVLNRNFPFQSKQPKIRSSDIYTYDIPGLAENTLVFINGIFYESLSSIQKSSNGIIISPLQLLLQNGNRFVYDHLAKYAEYHKEIFTALNTAFIQDGVFIYIPSETRLKKPIQILNISDPKGMPFQSFHRNLIVSERGSQVTVIERQHHLSQGEYLHNSVTEIVVGDEAHTTLITLQEETRDSFLIKRTQAKLNRNSRFNHLAVDLGGNIVRNNLGISLNGENSETHLFGFYLASGNQHVDNHTNIDHLQPHCDSNELYKGILNDRGRGVFSGTIYVARDAQKTNAFQSNRSLLLSDEAEVDSKPQLKIFADDVKCTHGATIGQIDDEAVFYLQQRGISKADAFTLLRSAFAGEIIENIEISELREYIHLKIKDRLIEEF